VHAAFSVAAIASWRLLHARIQQGSSRMAARYLFLLRMFPSIGTLLIAALLIIPAFFRYEPRASGEPVPIALAILASISLFVFVAGFVRTSSALLQSSRTIHSWLAGSQVYAAGLDGVSVHRCQLSFPVIAVLGLWPTRIIVSESIFSALSTDELDAALRHEAVHARKADILKKMLLQLSPTVLPKLDVLKPISSEWAKACELAADEDAVCEDPSRSVHLASALVKVARLSNEAQLPTLSAALVSDADLFLGHRVERLLQISENEATPLLRAMPVAKKLLISAGLLLTCLLAYPQALSLTHDVLEAFVRIW
jgi:hypothetical protein